MRSIWSNVTDALFHSVRQASTFGIHFWIFWLNLVFYWMRDWLPLRATLFQDYIMLIIGKSIVSQQKLDMKYLQKRLLAYLKILDEYRNQKKLCSKVKILPLSPVFMKHEIHWFEDRFRSENKKQVGFTAYSLSYVNVNEWEDEQIHEMLGNNVTQCYYPGYRLVMVIYWN